MSNKFSQILENLDKLKALPWKGILVTVTVSFVLANLGSTIISEILLSSGADDKKGRSPETRLGSAENAGRSSFDESKVKKIVSRNIFNPDGKTGEEGDEKGPQTPVGPGVAKSNLPIKVLGIIYGGDPYSGISVIEDTAKRTRNSFMVGDDVIPKVALLKEIRIDRIIIQRDGNLEYVELEKPEIVQGRRSKKDAKKQEFQGVAPIATAPPPEVFQEPGFDRKGANITMTEDYKRSLLSDLPKILQDAKAEPNYVDGELVGFKLLNIRMGSIYEKAGLRNDDVVLEVNGTPLTDTSQAIKTLNSLRQEPEIEVRVRRGSDTINIQLDVR
jgi:type II secretion system protein C